MWQSLLLQVLYYGSLENSYWRNHINVMCVAGALLKMHTLEFIWEFMLERNRINVMYVVKSLVKTHTLQFIREFILEFSSVA